MNLVQDAPTWLLALLTLLLVAAAIEDALRLKISNITCLGVLSGALVAMAFASFPVTLWQNALVFAALLAAGTLLFGAGKIGGGDVKLLAALGLWTNLAGAVWLLVTVFLAGGVIAVGFLLTRGIRRRAGGLRAKSTSAGIPYGLAIVAGAFIVFASQMGAFAPKQERPDPLTIKPLG